MNKRQRRRRLARQLEWSGSLGNTQARQDAMAFDWHAKNEEANRPAGIPVVHPEEWKRWLEQGPCPGCRCEAWCDRICALRAKWWDDVMGQVRRKLRITN